MKYFARVAVLVFSCVTLTSVGFAKTSTYAKKTSHSKTKSSKKAMSDLDSIQLDEEEDTPTKSARKTASVEAVEDFSEKIEEASKLEKAGDPAKAIALLTPISEKLGRQGLLVLARAHRANKNSIAALKTLELCLSKNSNDYVVQTLIGDVLADTPNTDDAVAAYNAARKMNKNYRPAYEGLLALFEKKQEHYESRMLLTDMVALFKNVPRYYSDLCRLYSNGDFMAKATEICGDAIKRDPRNADNHVYLALSLRDTEKQKEAEKVLEKAVRRFPASEPIHSAAADMKASGKDYGSAYTLYKKATEVDPKSERAWLGLAQSSFELQKNGESLQAYVSACKVDKKVAREFRAAIGKLRNRSDHEWASKFEDALGRNCE